MDARGRRLAKRLRELRGEHTQKAAAAAAGISPSYLCRIEDPDDRTMPNLKALYRLADFYGVEAGAIIGVDPYPLSDEDKNLLVVFRALTPNHRKLAYQTLRNMRKYELRENKRP